MNDWASILGTITGVPGERFRELDLAMAESTGSHGIGERVAGELRESMVRALKMLGCSESSAQSDIERALLDTLSLRETEFRRYLEAQDGETFFERAAGLARRMGNVGKGFFLRREHARRILLESNPEHLLAYRGYKSVRELVEREDVLEAMSALRFTESDAWMHKTFERFYSELTASDFEERDIELRVLGPGWEEIAAQFVRKKHHNVSHLKEFGVIFLNPIAENVGGKLIRDFALLLHYLHEVSFYATLFREHAQTDDFSKRFKSFLRGDVPDRTSVAPGEWLIIQRYLWKENPSDVRLGLPRVNPESFHWKRGERDFVTYCTENGIVDFSLWKDRDWVGWRFSGINGPTLTSFDLEDTAMSLVSRNERTGETLTYHMQEAFWLKLFEAYVGSEERIEKLLTEQLLSGSIQFELDERGRAGDTK
jgi:hypothetical protein